jgi:hypothetical protein
VFFATCWVMVEAPLMRRTAAISLGGLDHGAQNAQGVNAGMFAEALGPRQE